MKILVPLKPVPDPEQKFTIVDGQFDFAGVGTITNPFDEYALEAALRLTDDISGTKPVRGRGELVAVSIGETAACTKVLKRALGLGVDRVYHVEATEAELDVSVVAKVLARLYEVERPDLILMGKQSVDGDSGLVPQYLAGLLGLPQAVAIASLTVEQGMIRTAREVEGGVEHRELTTPAVVSVDLRIVAPESVTPPAHDGHYPWADGPRYPSIRGMLKTKKAIIDPIPLRRWLPDVPHLTSHSEACFPPKRPPGIMVSSPAELAQQLAPFMVREGSHE